LFDTIATKNDIAKTTTHVQKTTNTFDQPVIKTLKKLVISAVRDGMLNIRRSFKRHKVKIKRKAINALEGKRFFQGQNFRILFSQLF